MKILFRIILCFPLWMIGYQPGLKAQSYIDQMLNYQITVYDSNYVVIAYTRPGKAIKIRDQLQYFWFSGGQIHHTQGGYSGKLLNGAYQKFYPDKKLCMSGSFKQGLKTGNWKSWDANGFLNETVEYKQGQRNGKYLRYDSLGKLKEHSYYVDDSLSIKPVSKALKQILHFFKARTQQPKLSKND